MWGYGIYVKQQAIIVVAVMVNLLNSNSGVNHDCIDKEKLVINRIYNNFMIGTVLLFRMSVMMVRGCEKRL
jgi:hypothetical protein